MTCDFYIPENLARLTDDMPLAIINTVKILPSPYTLSIGGKFASQEKLIAAHVPLERYSLHLKLLCFYINHTTQKKSFIVAKYLAQTL